MPEASANLVSLFVGRLAPAITFGLAAGLLGWLLGMARSLGALSTVAAVAMAFLAASWPGAFIAALTLALAGIVARVSHAAGGNADQVPAKLGYTTVLALTAVALLCAVAALPSAAPTYWLGAMCGALTAAVATWSGAIATAAGSGHRYALWSLRRVSNPGGGLSGAGLAVAASATSALATAGLRMHLVGPGDPALIGIAAVVATATATSPKRSGSFASARRIVLASVLGAVLSAVLMALVP